MTGRGARRYRTREGMEVLLEESHTLPLVDVELVLRTGAASDPKGLDGLTRLLWSTARKGTGAMGSHEIEERIAGLGARLSIDVATSYVRVGGSVVRRNLEPFVDLLVAIVCEPALRQRDLGRAKRESLAHLVALRDSDGSLCGRAFRPLLFGAHAHGRSMFGTPASLRRARLGDLRALHRKSLVAKNMIFAASGDLTARALQALVARCLSGLPRGEAPRIKLPGPRMARGRRVLVVDKPERTQCQLLIGTLGSRVRDPHLDALSVANTAFGGMFSSRLMQEVREKRGWSYGAYSRLGTDRQREAWTLGTAPAAKDVVPCLELQLSLVDAFVRAGPSAEEHRFAKRFLVSSRCFDVETSRNRLSYRVGEALFRLPLRWHARYERRIRGVTVEQSRLAVKKRLSSRDLSIVLVATATDRLLADLRALPGVSSVKTVAFDRV